VDRHVFKYVGIRTHACMYACMRVCLCACVHVCMCACVFAYICVRA